MNISVLNFPPTHQATLVPKPEFRIDYNDSVTNQISKFIKKLEEYHCQPCLSGFITENVLHALNITNHEDFVRYRVISDLFNFYKLHPIPQLYKAICLEVLSLGVEQ